MSGYAPPAPPREPIGEAEARRRLSEVGRRLYERGYIVATDGNVSMRLPPPGRRMLITPSGACKGDVSPEAMVVVDLDTGRPLDPSARPSSEMRLHVVAYAERPDVNAVLHAHPPFAVAFSLAGVEIAQCLLPEVLIGLGAVETTEYATPTTQAAADAIRGIVRTSDAIVLDRHGSVTVGATLEAAYFNLERLEWAARVTHAARQLGSCRPLPKGEVERLLLVRAKLSGRARPEPCNLCGACIGSERSAPLALAGAGAVRP